MQTPNLACYHLLSRLHEQYFLCPWWLRPLLPASKAGW